MPGPGGRFIVLSSETLDRNEDKGGMCNVVSDDKRYLDDKG